MDTLPKRLLKTMFSGALFIIEIGTKLNDHQKKNKDNGMPLYNGYQSAIKK